MLIGVEMRQIENQPLVIFTNVVTVGEQLIEIAENKKQLPWPTMRQKVKESERQYKRPCF